MLSCWKVNPDDRPSFDEHVHTISSFLNPLADYMEASVMCSAMKMLLMILLIVYSFFVIMCIMHIGIVYAAIIAVS